MVLDFKGMRIHATSLSYDKKGILWQFALHGNTYREVLADSFMREIGSQYGIVSGSRENSLYNALWVAQALLRKG